jgi:hypothetical protein
VPSFKAVDRNGTVIGDSPGYYSGVYPQVAVGGGTLIAFDSDATNANAFTLLPGILYYLQLNCAGTPYVTTLGIYPPDFGAILAVPAVPGSDVYKATGAPQTISVASTRGAGACANGASSRSNAYVAQVAGSVPAAVKPLHLVPAN